MKPRRNTQKLALSHALAEGLPGEGGTVRNFEQYGDGLAL
jgi:hypothetical protein